MAIEHPYLMFLGDAADQLAAKVANGANNGAMAPGRSGAIGNIGPALYPITSEIIV